MAELFPDHVYLFGAGRWARVICSVLLKELPEHCKITVISPGHAQVMKEWAKEKNLAVDVGDTMPAHAGMRAAIVANAAKDHVATAQTLLQQGIPTLVEKPLALSAADIERLIGLSKKTALLAVSHVFLFATYLERFRESISALPALTRASFVWEDPVGEQRYGEAKRYDATLSLIADVFPHIYSILHFLMPETPVVYRGSDKAGLQLSIGGAPCEVVLARDSTQRTRRIIFETMQGNATLDFTSEPGIIAAGGQSRSGDTQWPQRPSPLTQQLHAFLAACAGKAMDARLDPSIDLAASRIIDTAWKDNG